MQCLAFFSDRAGTLVAQGSQAFMERCGGLSRSDHKSGHKSIQHHTLKAYNSVNAKVKCDRLRWQLRKNNEIQWYGKKGLNWVCLWQAALLLCSTYTYYTIYTMLSYYSVVSDLSKSVFYFFMQHHETNHINTFSLPTQIQHVSGSKL